MSSVTMFTHGLPLEAPARVTTVGGRVTLTVEAVLSWRAAEVNVHCRAARLVILAGGCGLRLRYLDNRTGVWGVQPEPNLAEGRFPVGGQVSREVVGGNCLEHLPGPVGVVAPDPGDGRPPDALLLPPPDFFALASINKTNMFRLVSRMSAVTFSPSGHQSPDIRPHPKGPKSRAQKHVIVT